MAEEVCKEYRSSLEDLTFNSKPLINVLTMLAEENIQYAPKIVQIIENHLRKAKSEHKLPVMYLIDSIIKNIGKDYLGLFRQNIVSNFCTVFEKGDEKVRMMLFKLRQTWSEVFMPNKLNAIDTRVKQLDPAWPVVVATPRQTASVHVNPKFLDSAAAPTPKVKAPPASSMKTHEQLEAEMNKKLKEKQEELLRLQQQALQLEYLKTKAELDEKTKKLQELQQQTIQGCVVPSQSEPQANILKQSKDPRLNSNSSSYPANRDPRIYAKQNPYSNRTNSPVNSLGNQPPVNDPRLQNASALDKPDAPKVTIHAPTKRPYSPAKTRAANEKKNLTKTENKEETSPKKSKSSKSKDSPKSKKHSSKSSPNTKSDKSPKKKSSNDDVELKFGNANKRSRSPALKNNSSKVEAPQEEKVRPPQEKKTKTKKHDDKPKENDVCKKLMENTGTDEIKTGDVDLRKMVPDAVPKPILEDVSEPPNKKLKEETLNDLFGSQDIDYRSEIPQSNGTSNKKGWAKFKDEHADEYPTPRKRTESSASDTSFTLANQDTDLRIMQEKQTDSPKTPTRNKLESSVQMAVMMKNKDAILKGAEEKMHKGQMNEQQYADLQRSLGEVEKFRDERKKHLRDKERQKNLKRKIMIDNKMREIRFENGCGIVSMDNHVDHLIYFKGDGRNVTINKQTIFLNFNGERKYFKVNGKEHSVMFGGPTRELFVDDIPYEGRFGGPPVGVTISGKVYKAQLAGPAPDVDVRPLQNRDYAKQKSEASADKSSSKSSRNSPSRGWRNNRRNRHNKKNEKNLPPVPKSPPEPFAPAELEDRVPKLPELPIEPLFPSAGVSSRIKPLMDPMDNMSHDNRPPGHGRFRPGSRNDFNNKQKSPPRNFKNRHSRFGPAVIEPEKPVIKWNRPEDLMNNYDNANQRRMPLSGPSGLPLQQQAPIEPNPVLNAMLPPTLPFIGLPDASLPPPLQPIVNLGALAAQPINPVASLDVSSLFDQLVSSGIINKSQSGAGYNVGSQKTPEKPVINPVVPESAKEKVSKPPSSEDVIPSIDLNSAALKKSYPGVSKLLYKGTKCESCGVRFTAEHMDKYSQHLDWHFRSNRREKDGAKKANSRKWFFEVEDWIQFEEIEDLEERAQSYFEVLEAEEEGNKVPEAAPCSVPASENSTQNVCTVCGEQFENFWDEDEESWRLRDAIRVSEKAYHPLCYEDSQKCDEENAEANFLSLDSITSSAGLPGLDLIEEEETKPPPFELIPADKIKKEPVDDDDDDMSIICDNDDSIRVIEPTPKKQPETIDLDEAVKAEQTKPDDHNEPKEEAPDCADGKENAESDDKVLTPSADEPIDEAPLTPAADEKIDLPENIDESSQPEPERVRIAPQTGSAISLNLCKSTVDTRLAPASEQSAPESNTNAIDDWEGEKEMEYPPADPRFAIQERVLRGTELSGLCSIM